jgi:hypothetical protein
MPLTNSTSPVLDELAPEPDTTRAPTAGFASVGRGPLFGSNESYLTTLDMLFVGCRVCIRRKPQTRGEVVRVMPTTHRVVVRLDPRYSTRRGTLRSLRPENLVICP